MKSSSSSKRILEDDDDEEEEVCIPWVISILLYVMWFMYPEFDVYLSNVMQFERFDDFTLASSWERYDSLLATPIRLSY